MSKIAGELVRMASDVAREVVAGKDIDISDAVADAYMRMGRYAYKTIKRMRGVEKQSALKERNRNNNTFSFEWEYEGYTRSDFEAKASVTIVMYLQGEVYVWVRGERPDWKGGASLVLDKKYNGVIPVSDIEAALEIVFG